MSDTFMVAKNNEVTLKIVYDSCPENPRDWDNLGTMVAWHRKYDLGDKHRYADTTDLFESLIRDVLDKSLNMEYSFAAPLDYENDVLFDCVMEFLKPKDLEGFVKQYYTILPLYLYDHSGTIMNTTGFSCPWDSGQVGWIFCSHKRMKEETGYTKDELFSTDKHRTPQIGERVKIASRNDLGQIKSISGNIAVVDFDYNKALNYRKKENIVSVPLTEIKEVLSNKAEEILVNEVKIYDQYLRGDVYSFILEDNGDVIESCHGFYGNNFKENGMLDCIPNKYKYLIDRLTICA